MKPVAYLAAVLRHYPKLCSSSNIACWASFSDDGVKGKAHGIEVCHASMQWDPAGCDHVITNYKVQDEDLDIRWFKFMRGRLYHQFADHLHLRQTKDGRYYLHIDGLDVVPANVVYNICITSRIIIEFRKNLKFWGSLVDQGIDEGVAFLYMGATDKIDIKVGSLFGNVSNTNHWPIDNSNCIDRILNGDLTNLSSPFKTQPMGCRPCNVIWGELNRGLYPLCGKTILDFVESLKTKDAKHEDVLLAS